MSPSPLRRCALLAALAACEGAREEDRRPPHGGGYSRVAGVARTRFEPLGVLTPGARVAVEARGADVWRGYELSLSTGAVARLRFRAERGALDLVLYGPRTPQGLWGAPLARAAGGEKLRYAAASAGVYFVLLWAPRGAARGELRFECDGCRPPPCPPPAACDLFCEGGYAPAAGACLSCACAAAPACEGACPEGGACVAGRCESPCEASCDPRPAPVCGEDGRLYPNACLAACAAVAQVARERCDRPRPCREDDECPLRSACREGVCAPREEERPEEERPEEERPEEERPGEEPPAGEGAEEGADEEG